MERIAIIGGGRIGEALLSGLLSSGWSDIVVTSRRMERVAELHERHNVEATTSNPDAVKGAAIVVIAVKPQDIEALLEEIGPLLSTDDNLYLEYATPKGNVLNYDASLKATLDDLQRYKTKDVRARHLRP